MMQLVVTTQDFINRIGSKAVFGGAVQQEARSSREDTGGRYLDQSMSCSPSLRLHLRFSEELMPGRSSTQRREPYVVQPSWKFVSDISGDIATRWGPEATLELVIEGTPLKPTTPVAFLRDSDTVWISKLCDGPLPAPAPPDRPWCRCCGTSNPFELSGAQQKMFQAGVEARCRGCITEALWEVRHVEVEEEEAEAPSVQASGEAPQDKKAKKKACASGGGGARVGSSETEAEVPVRDEKPSGKARSPGARAVHHEGVDPGSDSESSDSEPPVFPPFGVEKGECTSEEESGGGSEEEGSGGSVGGSTQNEEQGGGSETGGPASDTGSESSDDRPVPPALRNDKGEVLCVFCHMVLAAPRPTSTDDVYEGFDVREQNRLSC